METTVTFPKENVVIQGFYNGSCLLKPTEDMIGLWFKKGRGVLYENDEEMGGKFYQIVRITPEKCWVKEYDCKIIHPAKKEYTKIDSSIYGVARLGKETGKEKIVPIRGVLLNGVVTPYVRLGSNHFLSENSGYLTWYYHPRVKIPEI